MMGRRSFRALATAVLLAALCAVGGCDGDSDGAPFAGIHNTYVLANGARQLALQGVTGTYTATTPSGTQSQPVALTRDDLSIGARTVPYLASGELIVGGGYAGFATGSVVSDPRAVPGVYTTMTGANFAGELQIAASGDYVWCMRGPLTGITCADGSQPSRGATSVQSPLGFTFAGLQGVYAIYREGKAAAIFPVSAQSLRLMAFTSAPQGPRGSFRQPAASALAPSDAIEVAFNNGHLEISGDSAWTGTYTYSVDAGGVVRFASPQCPGSVCNAIYNNSLGTLYVARLGNGLFIR